MSRSDDWLTPEKAAPANTAIDKSPRLSGSEAPCLAARKGGIVSDGTGQVDQLPRRVGREDIIIAPKWTPCKRSFCKEWTGIQQSVLLQQNNGTTSGLMTVPLNSLSQ